MSFLFRIMPQILETATLDAFLNDFSISADDIVITDRVLLTEERRKKIPCRMICQDDFGTGEPSIERIDCVIAAVSQFEGRGRIIGLGGGSALDIAKIAALDLPDQTCVNVFEGRQAARRTRGLLLLPTTCGTGSEVTNISVVSSERTHVKHGIADDALYADVAVLIPELLCGIPYHVLLSSSMDALIHAVESFLSPKASQTSRLFSTSAVRAILQAYLLILQKGEDIAADLTGILLRAANHAGIAFSNAGCGQIHAMSYPLGAAYHIPHGEANHQLFGAIMNYYSEKNPDGALAELCGLFQQILGNADKGCRCFNELIAHILPRKPLSVYGMTEQDCIAFAHMVKETQGRLTQNAYVPVSEEDMIRIYETLL